MPVKIQVKINSTTIVEAYGPDEKEAIRLVAFFTELPKKCPLCGEKLYLTYRSPQTFHYYGMACEGSPRHKVNFGEKKDGTGLYYKDEWEEDQYAQQGERDTRGEQQETRGEQPPPPDGPSEDEPW